jgi:hypothetical protein
MRPWWLYRIGKISFFVFLAMFGFGYVVMELWNALIPSLFGGPVVTFWQAVGLLLLSHILFRGMGHGYYGKRSHNWRKRFEEKLASMTPDEQEKFKREWKDRCGWYPGMEKDLQTQGQPKT